MLKEMGNVRWCIEICCFYYTLNLILLLTSLTKIDIRIKVALDSPVKMTNKASLYVPVAKVKMLLPKML